ncbi:MAG: DUF4349 domain-containing protein [Acidimicrobiales bacterium]|nr:DUF4349 domain-containing protein [Acidimicrobiales bacterium]
MTMNRFIAVFAAVALLLAACGEASDEGISASDDGAMESAGTEFAGDDGEMSEEAGGADLVDSSADVERAQINTNPAAPDLNLQPGTPGDESSTEVQPVDTGRQIIRTANILAEVTDVAAASQQAINTVSSVGGLLFNQDTRVASNNIEANRTTLVFRVPPADFQRVLNSLGGIGNVREQTIDATDVTGRVVDLESQITSTELSVERLRGFLAGATDLTQVAAFENELRNRETDLETLRGQLRTIQNQVSLSTITITFTEILAPAKPTPNMSLASFLYQGHDGGFSCGSNTGDVRDGDLLTICFEVTNSGATGLTDVVVRDSALDIDVGDMTLVEGNADTTLEPGQRLMYAYEFTATGNRLISTTRAQATAVPSLDAETDELASTTADARAELSRSILPKISPAGFADGLSTGWDGLTALIRTLLVALGFALPFIWLLPLAWFAGKEWKKRQAKRPSRGSWGADPTPPPPPPATAETKVDVPA